MIAAVGSATICGTFAGPFRLPFMNTAWPEGNVRPAVNLLAAVLFSALLTSVCLSEEPTTAAARPGQKTAEAVQDNSFFVEEAYNQEANVVQHIFMFFADVNHLTGPHEREVIGTFTQEWPILSQEHQFSYTVPYQYLDTGELTDHDFGDVLLNYRLQLFTETDDRPAVAPRFTVILPSGNEHTGLGAGSTGWQFNLPVSKVVSDRWTLHGNAGTTWFPSVHEQSLLSYNLGASLPFDDVTVYRIPRVAVNSSTVR